jgi:hypothetical protein
MIGIVPEVAWWVEILAHAAVTAAIAFLAVYFNKRIHINQELIKARIGIIGDYSNQLNQIFCFYTQVGDFKNLNPDAILSAKRQMEKLAHVNRSIFSEKFFNAHRDFMTSAFHEYSGAGISAKLRVNVKDIMRHFNDMENIGWNEKCEPTTRREEGIFLHHHQNLLNQMAKEMGL